ncbi:diacylglycerol kinase family protein [Deinococcus sp. QL22]|uniref:diacylglycerol/lipid kinase family protein n=1 Tax=Deinococcus sp. QL22 TaxID=2939437 RepID=UPI002018382C|nr:diacylglycerol kinase family protein [Deinococcus sp. QL22]UQN05794.1 diacylglycerol kinase family lipid kinase [Deinococcus sp. QL22]
MTSAPFPPAPSAQRRYAVVLNPHAGRGLASREWPRLEGELQARRFDFELISAGSGDDALARVQALPADVAVLAVGGDGTVGALLPALIGNGARPLAIVPLGSGNDYAGMLGLKAGQFGEALDRLSYTPRRVDALEATVTEGAGAGVPRLLLNGLGMGFDAQVAATMLRAPARLTGFGRYLWGALAALRDLQLTDLTLSVDGQTVYSGPSCLAAVMNGTRYGGGFLISPQSDAHDGKLNALASGPVTRPQLLGLMGRVLRGTHLGQPRVYHATGQAVTIRWAAPTHLHLDGDLSGEVREIQVRVLAGAVTLLNG